MNNFKKSFVLVFICIIFLCPQTANAGTASNVVDKGINYTGRATYYVTKYALKTVCFVVIKTAKGVKIISKSIFNGTKDAFKSAPKTQTAKPNNKNPDSIYILPPVPKIN